MAYSNVDEIMTSYHSCKQNTTLDLKTRVIFSTHFKVHCFFYFKIRYSNDKN